MNKIIFFSLLFFVCLHGHPQQRFFSGYSISDGLSQSVVNCIYQDSRGFMWFGTQNGLNRFNGYSFEVFIYKPNDTTSISNNWIYSITEDRQGNLWIGTKGGLNRFITKEKRFERIQYTSPYSVNLTEYIYDVKTSANGNILINTPPVLSVCDPEKMVFRHYISPLPYDESVNDYNIPLLEDQSGKIWIGSPGGLTRFDPDSGKFDLFAPDLPAGITLSGELITALYQDKAGSIWIGTPTRLICYGEKDRTLSIFRNIPGDPSSLSHNFIRAIKGDASGKLWIATEGGGLHLMNRDPKGKVYFDVFTEENSGLRHNIILALQTDHSGNLWIGTLSGLSKTDLKKQKFRLYRRSDSPASVDLAGNVIASVYKDRNDVVWIGHWGQGLDLFDRKSRKVEHYSVHLDGKYHIPDNYVHTIFRDNQNNTWIGTRDGLLLWQENSRSFIRPSLASENPGLSDFRGLRIFMMMQDRLNQYWVATQNGLYRMNTGSKKSDRFHSQAAEEFRISGNLVYGVMEDRDSLIWMATTQGLDVLDPDNGRIQHFNKSNRAGNSLSDDFITSLCEDHNGDIWIGTSSYLDKFSKKDSTFTYYSQENGLPGNLVYSIQQDKSNGLWVATGNGLCRYDAASNSFHAYSVEDGIQSPEYNLRASCVSDDGEVFFGGMNGLNTFYPDSLSNNSFVPPVVITSAYKMKKGVREYINVEKSSRIVLPHNENSLTIEFAALEFTHPAKNRYMYHFEGMDEEWVDIGNRRFVSFFNLSPGEYLLKIKGSNNDGLWNDQGTSLRIIIKSPWWTSDLALFFYLLMAILLVTAIIKRRERQHILDKKILEENVSERTRQIEDQKAEILKKNEELNELNASKDKFFSIIAHDLRNPFNTIIGLSEILLMNLENADKAKMQKSLENIKGSSQQAYELLENLLMWARSHTGIMIFHPRQVHLKTLVEESIFLVNAHALRKNISLNADDLQDVVIPADVNMIQTVLRNLLTNALKFTPQNGQVWVGLTEADGYCLVVVKDTGMGIEQERIKSLFKIDSSHRTKGTDKEPGTGLGLILCREFVFRHGGKIEVESEPGKGSEFRVFLPLHPDQSGT